MANRNRETMFNYFISGMEKEMQSNLRLLFTQMCMEEQYQKAREREQLKKEITAEILANINATVDVSEIIQEIEELRRAIDSLGR